MTFKDYYKILGLENKNVTQDKIKSAYREQAKKYHPDINGNSEERFKDINEAYSVLSNSAAKRKYDRMWMFYIGRAKKTSTKENKTIESIKNDFVNMFFGNSKDEDVENVEKFNFFDFNKKIPEKGENVETEIKISIEEAFYGVTKKISIRTIDEKIKTFTINIPAGIKNQEKMRLVGQGKLGKNGGKNGDLFITINLENSNKFRIDGIDLYTDLYLTPWEAALGTRAAIDGIDEQPLVYIPQGTQSGEKIRLPGKGYSDGKGGRGELIAEVKIMVPKQLTLEEKKLYEDLRKISKFNPRNSRI